MGEDWKGLENIINVSSLAYKDEILSAIKRHHTDVAREAAIRSLDEGKVYAELLSTVYPTLRRTVFHMRFDVRSYTDDELEEMFITVPGCLSQYEMCRLAQQYVEQGKNPVNIYKKAYEQFALDLLREKKILIVHGSGFNWKQPDHFRVVYLPRIEVLKEAVGKISDFLSYYRPVSYTHLTLPTIA